MCHAERQILDGDIKNSFTPSKTMYFPAADNLFVSLLKGQFLIWFYGFSVYSKIKQKSEHNRDFLTFFGVVSFSSEGDDLERVSGSKCVKREISPREFTNHKITVSIVRQ